MREKKKKNLLRGPKGNKQERGSRATRLGAGRFGGVEVQGEKRVLRDSR